MSELELIAIIKELDKAGEKIEDVMYLAAELLCRKNKDDLKLAKECIYNARRQVVSGIQDLVRGKIEEKHGRKKNRDSASAGSRQNDGTRC